MPLPSGLPGSRASHLDALCIALLALLLSCGRYGDERSGAWPLNRAGAFATHALFEPFEVATFVFISPRQPLHAVLQERAPPSERRAFVARRRSARPGPGPARAARGEPQHHAALLGETLVLGARNADGTWRAMCTAVPRHEFTLNAANCVPAPEAGPGVEAPDWDALVRPLKERYDTFVTLLSEGAAVEASNLSELDESGCAAGATALFETCHPCLVSKDASRRIPPHALVNGTWQVAVPPELRFESVEHPDGLNLVEMSMIAIYNPILTVTILTGGARVSLY